MQDGKQPQPTHNAGITPLLECILFLRMYMQSARLPRRCSSRCPSCGLLSLLTRLPICSVQPTCKGVSVYASSLKQYPDDDAPGLATHERMESSLDASDVQKTHVEAWTRLNVSFLSPNSQREPRHVILESIIISISVSGLS